MGLHFRTITEVLDFGPYITTIILQGNGEAGSDPVSKEDFSVHVVRRTLAPDFPWPAFMGERPSFPMEGERTVTDAFRSDENGVMEEDGAFITLRLVCDPRDGLGSIIRFNGQFNTSVETIYTVTRKTGDKTCVYDVSDGNEIVYGDLLEEGRNEEAGLSYVYYLPENRTGDRVPLIIWLHGAGEGGSEPRIAAIGNKVVNLISPDIQELFGGKACLLAPQCPTMWMDDGEGYTRDGSSIYAEGLEKLIADFVSAHPDIDLSRIYLGGDSNGGYMTVRMALVNPVRYAAIFPVCEAYADEWIGERELEILKKIPSWFTAAKTDNVVPVDRYCVPTVKRLKEAGADCHLTLWDRVEDHTGFYKKEDGTPYEYAGHWSWIPMLNDECRLDCDGKPVLVDGEEASLLMWLASQKKA